MNLKAITDNSLHEGNIETAREEREILVRILHRLRETERRKLYSKFKCKSLFDYCVKYMGYSNDQADRRIKAMRLLKEVPEIEEKIAEGSLTLTNLALAQKLFVYEEKVGENLSVKQKCEILHQLENQTTRAAERIVYEIRPEMRPKPNDLNFYSIEDDSLREKLLQVKGLYAHTDPYMNLQELLHKLCDEKLVQKTTVSRAPKMNSKAEVGRRVRARDKGRCVNCGSTHALQIEHIIPRAVGGKWTPENLCLLCRSCNQRSAINFYGLAKMAPYLDGA